MTPIIASTSSRSVSPSSSPSSRARTLTSSSRRVPPSSPPSPPAVLAPLLLPLQVEPLRLHRLKRRRRIKWKRRRVRRLRICRVALPSRRIKLTSRSHTTPQSPTTTWASDSSTNPLAPECDYESPPQPKSPVDRAGLVLVVFEPVAVLPMSAVPGAMQSPPALSPTRMFRSRSSASAACTRLRSPAIKAAAVALLRATVTGSTSGVHRHSRADASVTFRCHGHVDHIATMALQNA